METKNEFVQPASDCEITATRVVNAPRELVYKAWTDPNHLIRWWGPKGFTNTFKEFDLRPNGKWSFVMHGPDGGHFNNECVFIKSQEPELIEWNHLSDPKFKVVGSFEDLKDGKSKVQFKMIFDTPEECSRIKSLVEVKNEENLDKLEKELTRMREVRLTAL